MHIYDFKVLLEPDEIEGYVAVCPGSPDATARARPSTKRWPISRKRSSSALKISSTGERKSRILPACWFGSVVVTAK